MTDVLLFQGPNGGEIEVVNGIVTLDPTPFSAIYLSLWGGNLEDDGTTSTASRQWWGNLDEPDQEQHLRSRTQNLLISLPAIPANLIRVEEAVEADLAWLTSEIADAISVTASLPARNTVRIQIQIAGRDGTPYPFDFTRPWGPSSSLEHLA